LTGDGSGNNHFAMKYAAINPELFVTNRANLRKLLPPNSLVVSKLGESASASSQSIAAGIAEYLSRAKMDEMEGVHGRVIEEVERELFGQAIRLAQGNQARAARWLGVSRITMREKLHHFGLHPSGQAGGD